MENIQTAPDEGRSPCVRAFVANFERRDPNSGIGNENRPPVVTKSKVALLRETLGKPSDSVKRTSSDYHSDGDVKINEAANADTTSDSEEHNVSVSKLKENLQKSASEKRVAPWAFGGAGRPVKEPRKPPPKKTNNFESDAEAKSAEIDDSPKVTETTKRKVNNSFKRSQENLFEPSFKSEPLDKAAFVGNSFKVSATSNRSDILHSQLNRSSSTGENETGEKHKMAPKVLPKPAPRKSKPKLVCVSYERSQSDDKSERTAYQKTSVTPEDSSSLAISKKLGSMEILHTSSTSCDRSDSPEVPHTEISEIAISSEECRKPVHRLRDVNQIENTSVNETGEEAHTVTGEPHDIESNQAKKTADDVIYCSTSSDELHTDDHLETYDKDLGHTTDASNSVPPNAIRTDGACSIDSRSSDVGDDQEMDYSTTARGSIAEENNHHLVQESQSYHRISSEGTPSLEQNERAANSISSEHITALVISDDESITDENSCSKIDDDSALPSGENRTRSPDEDVMHGIDSISLVQKSTQVHDNLPENCNAIASAPNESDDISSTENSIFLRCMGPDFIAEIKELSSITAEEQDYEALAAVVCCKMCEQEEEGISWLLCPPETYRSTVDYVGSLFKDDIFMGIGERKVSTWAVEESSFMSPDSLREMLLDKATKKLERLKVQKQKLDAVITKQVELEERVDAVAKDKVDSRQYSKYRSTVEEFDRVTHLLLMLSSRLANTDNSLDQISFSDDERQKAQLIAKRDNLIEKFEEARSIKDNSRTRRQQVADCLQRHLAANEFSDYQQLMKTICQLKLLRHSLEDRVSLSEEQIKVLVAVIEKNTSAKYC